VRKAATKPETVPVKGAIDVVVWRCLACGSEGRISNWQGTLWDLSQGTP